jgi:hypothetical protein
VGKKYTTSKINIDFEIDDDKFFLKEVIPAGVIFEFSNIQSRMTEAKNKPGESLADVMLECFEKLLTPESFEIFNARFFGMSKLPIDFATFSEVTQDILTEIAGKGQSDTSTSSVTG